MKDSNYQYGKIFRRLKYLQKKLEENISDNKMEALEMEFEALKKRIPKLIYSPRLHGGQPYKNDQRNT